MELKKLGKYEIVSKIGEGAMGEVYKAHDPVLGRDVAIKTMSAAIGADNELRQRFEREARSAARLNHPNIVTVYDFGEENGRAFIAMELLEGEDLSETISRRAALNLDAKVGLMEQMAEGLAFAHARDVVHRDLKPGNIHVQHGGQVKIMDFGLARLSTSNMTRAGMVMGTPNYMSPEQVRGERATSRSDVFSLGSVFYELLTYHKPFDADSLHAVLFQVMQSEPEPIASAVPGLPPPLRHLIERAMAKDPGRRFKDAGELREALRSVRAGLSAAFAAHSPLDLPTMAFPAATANAPTARSPVTAGHAPGTAVAIVPEATRLDLPLEATVAQEAATLAASPSASAPTQMASPATQLDAKPPTRRPGVATAPPSSQAPRSLPRPLPPAARPASRLALIAGGAAALVVAAGVAGVRLTRETPAPAAVPASIAPQPTPVPPTAAPSAGQPPTATPAPDLGPAVAEAQRSLEDRDYRSAQSRAQAILARERGNEEAERILGAAREAIRAGDAAARELRSALDAKDADRASSALKRLGSVDPRNPELAALTVRVGDVVSRRAAETQRAIAEAEARRQAATPAPTPRATPVPQATAPPATLPPTPPPPTAPTAPPATAAPARLTPAEVDAARKSIRGVLDEYRVAVGTLNAEYLRRLHPKVDYEGMRANFGNVQKMDVKIDVKDVTVAPVGDTASAQCLVTYTPIPKPAGGRMPAVPTTFKLRRTGTGLWIIDEVETGRR